MGLGKAAGGVHTAIQEADLYGAAGVGLVWERTHVLAQSSWMTPFLIALMGSLVQKRMDFGLKSLFHSFPTV